MEEWKEYRLEELTIGKGEYGIGASAVPFDSSKYTYLRITDINDDGTLNKQNLMSVDDINACNYILQNPLAELNQRIFNFANGFVIFIVNVL